MRKCEITEEELVLLIEESMYAGPAVAVEDRHESARMRAAQYMSVRGKES